MAVEDTKGKKRKGAADAAPKPKKQKKTDSAAAPTKASTKALKAAVNAIDDLPTKTTVTRRRAEDSLDDHAPVNDEPAKAKTSKKKRKAGADADAHVDAAVSVNEKAKKTEKSKSVEEEAVGVPKDKTKKSKKAKQVADSEVASAETTRKIKDFLGEDSPVAAESKKPKKAKAPKKQKEEAKEPTPEPEIEAESGDDDNDGEDDQTAALLAGFESEEEDEEDLGKDHEDFSDDKVMGQVPKGLIKKANKASTNENEPGVIFVGRIPHGFYEPQMKSYFSQFGKVTRLRVSRNKKTGASKHYAFVEFASAEVADIVAKTMDKYLMFGHILQCRVIPSEQVHPELFVGANQRFKTIPRNKMAGAEMARGAEREVWEKRVKRANKNMKKGYKKLKDVMDYEYDVPALKSVEDVAKKTPALEDGSAQQLLAEASAAEDSTAVHNAELKPNQLSVTETVKVKKSKKGAKGKPQDDVVPTAEVPEKVLEAIENAVDKTDEVPEKVDAVGEKKARKGRNSKAAGAAAVPEEKVEEPVATKNDASTIKVKGGRKAGKTEDVVQAPQKEKKRKSIGADGGDAKPKKTKKAKA